jgi:hypothetical protein
MATAVCEWLIEKYGGMQIYSLHVKAGRIYGGDHNSSTGAATINIDYEEDGEIDATD